MNLFETEKNSNYGDIDLDVIENTYNLDNFTSVNIKNPLRCNIEIVKTDYPQCRIYIKGTKKFNDSVKFEVKNNTCEIYIEDHDIIIANTKKNTDNDLIVLYVNFDIGEDLYIGVSGSGKVSSNIPFKSGTLKVNGSGKISTADFSEVQAKVSGSGNISVKNIKNTADFKISGSGNIDAELIGEKSNIKISGSGNVNIAEIFGNLSATILGGGNIDAHSGKINNIEIEILGNGNFNGNKLDVCNAEIKLLGSGEVTVNKISENFEFKGNSKKIKILDRV